MAGWAIKLTGDTLAETAQTARQIGEIAFRHGFSDAARFSHVFRNRYGVSPSEYRRQGRLPGEPAGCRRTRRLGGGRPGVIRDCPR